MRDPLEAKDVYVGVLAPTPTSLPATYDAAHADLNVRVNRVLKREFKLLSLTADDAPSPGGAFPVGDGHFGRCYARPRMWEQYAEGHKGLCLLFHYDEIIQTATTAFAAYQSYRHGSVSYRPMSVGLHGDLQVAWERVERQPVDELVEELIDERGAASFFEKFDDYASEQEYRFVVRAPREEYLQISFGSALKGVVLGAEFPSAELTPLFFLCAELGVALLRMEWRQGLGQIGGFYNPTIPFEHNHAPEVQPFRDELRRWHPTLEEYEAHTGGAA
jgi:hypothetical protein